MNIETTIVMTVLTILAALHVGIIVGGVMEKRQQTNGFVFTFIALLLISGAIIGILIS